MQVEVAVARLEQKGLEADAPVQVLRFANRVPLQFDKSACAIVQSICSVNWKSYGLAQARDAIPSGPFIIAVSVVSPFIKFKNASKETVDASDELVEEIRRTLMQAGQRLCRHIRAEDKANELEEKIRHIEQFGPILVQGLCNITKAPDARRKRAEDGLLKLLGRDARSAEKELTEAHADLKTLKDKMAPLASVADEDVISVSEALEKVEEEAPAKAPKAPKAKEGKTKPSKKAKSRKGAAEVAT